MFARALTRVSTPWVQSLRIGSRGAASAPGSAVEGPERDLVNFPRPEVKWDQHPVRMGFINQNWFDMFYDKTGVTGPYLFGAGLITFLISKEYYVLEHEFWGGLVMFSVYGVAIKKFGPNVSAYLEKDMQQEKKDLDSYRDSAIAAAKDGIEQCERSIEMAKGEATLFVAKKDNIGLQLEAAYRQRLQQVHSEVKKRLDYQLETANVKRRFEQRHMVDWIVSGVRASITPAQEAAMLKQCIVDLKGLAAKA